MTEISPLEIEEWPYPIKIYTLGDFKLLRDDEVVQFSGRRQKPLTLLKALIAFGGEGVYEGRLIDLLWPEAEGDLGHKSYEMAVLRLRRLMGKEGAVQLKGGALSLDRRYCRVDVWAIKEICGRARQLWAAAGKTRPREISEAVRLSEKALGMYRGDFLQADTHQPWTAPIREDIRSELLKLVDFMGLHWERAGQWDKAAECYHKGLHIDCLTEEFYQHLMVCCGKLGRRAEAARVYERCRSALSDTLGITPSDKTELIYSRIVRRR